MRSTINGSTSEEVCKELHSPLESQGGGLRPRRELKQRNMYCFGEHPSILEPISKFDNQVDEDYIGYERAATKKV